MRHRMARKKRFARNGKGTGNWNSMSALKTLYRHSSHYLGGRVAVMLLGFISFPLFTRVFSVSDYGAMNLIMNTVLLVDGRLKVRISTFGATLLSGRRQLPPDPDALRRYYSTLFYGTAFLALSSCARFFCVSVLIGVRQNFWGLLPRHAAPGLQSCHHPLVALHADQFDADGEQDPAL